jgi:CubicO group peptidase (beta-lactamase class C family)
LRYFTEPYCCLNLQADQRRLVIVMAELPTVRAIVEEAISAGRIPGAVVIVRHNGQLVHSSAHGVLDPDTPFPLRDDTVLWLASLSKVVGAAALLMLAEEGRLSITDAVSAYIPEFAAAGRVLVLRPGSPSPLAMPFGPPPDPLPEFDIAPAERELTLLDLLTHTGGLQSLMRWNPEFVPPSQGQTLADYVPGLGGLARDFQAGEAWAYSNEASFDVISRVIEIVSGHDLDTFLRNRIVEPLGLSSMGFGRGGQPGAMPVPPPFYENPVIGGTTFRSTCAGLWSSGADYLVFAEMLRNGGVHGRMRLLSEKSIEMMTTNHAGRLCPGLNGREPAPGIGFGLSVALIEDGAAAGEALPDGTFGWDGVATRRFWVCPGAGWSAFFYAPDVAVQREIEAAVTAALN